MRFLIGYVAAAVATGYAHLWGFPVIAAHGAFVTVEALRPGAGRAGPEAGRRGAGGDRGGRRARGRALPADAPGDPPDGPDRVPGLMVRQLVAALLQLVRFGSWTVAVHLVLVPIVLGGFARRGESPWRDRTFRLHANVIAWVLAGAMALHPINFGSRFLLGIEPSLWAVAAWGLSGFWRWGVGSGEGGARLVFSPHSPLPTPHSECGWSASGSGCWSPTPRLRTDPARLVREGAPSTEVHLLRKLPRAIGNPAAVAIVVAGLAAVGFRAAGFAPSPRIARLASRAAIAGWTAVAFASIVPLVLGPFAPGPPWAFEVHMVAVGAILLLAWEHRHDARALGALRYGLLATALIALFWLAGVPEPSVDPALALKLAVAALPVLVAVPLAGTIPGGRTGPRCVTQERGPCECSDAPGPGSSPSCWGATPSSGRRATGTVASRLMLTYALVDRGTIRIDGLEDQTGDKAYFRGHYYTDKLPGFSLLAAGPYAVAKAVLRLPDHPLGLPGFAYWPADYWVTLGTSGLLTACTGVVLVGLAPTSAAGRGARRWSGWRMAWRPRPTPTRR